MSATDRWALTSGMRMPVPLPAGRRTGALSAASAAPRSKSATRAAGPYRLAPGAVRRLPGRPAARLTVLAGCVWLTESGIAVDRFIGPGQTVPIGRSGRVVIECVSAQAAWVDVQPAAGPAAQRRFAGWIARASVRPLSMLRRLAQALAASLMPSRQGADLGVGALSEWQLRDIGACERTIQAAREREWAERRWRRNVLDGWPGSW